MNKISVSIMCADLLNLEREIRTLKDCGVDYLHIDVMDAHFVPNLTFGPDFVTAMHRLGLVPLDIHLMVEEPELIASRFECGRGDMVTVHAELGKDFSALASELHSNGVLFGIAINPETPVEAVEPYLGYCDAVLVMLVHPGFSGAKMVGGIMDKVSAVREYLDGKGHGNIQVSVDGSVSCERAARMAAMGADIFVGGTSGIYRKGWDVRDAVTEFRKAISVPELQ
jgi:ribulose-phosphate 3-epimerase